MLNETNNQRDSHDQQNETRHVQIVQIEAVVKSVITEIENALKKDESQELKDQHNLWKRIAKECKSPMIKPKLETGTESHPEEMQEENPTVKGPEDARKKELGSTIWMRNKYVDDYKAIYSKAVKYQTARLKDTDMISTPEEEFKFEEILKIDPTMKDWLHWIYETWKIDLKLKPMIFSASKQNEEIPLIPEF